MPPRSPRPAESTHRLGDTHAVLLAAELRPIIDATLCCVRADCPACAAGAADPAGIHRPLEVACSTSPVRVTCATGCEPTAVRTALLTPPTDWEAVAEQYRAIAADALQLLDASSDDCATPLHSCDLRVAA